MNISVSLATNILNKMKEIIHQDLNYIDKSGIIIASTDPNRTGTFHAAALKCIKKKLLLLSAVMMSFKEAEKESTCLFILTMQL